MAATYQGMNPELSERVRGAIAESNGQLWLSEGVRTNDEQWAFWRKAVRDHPQNPRAWAAVPGTSNHEKGHAADIGCSYSFNAQRAQLARKWGLMRPLPNEPWHCELDSRRGPMPYRVGTQPPPEVAQQEDEEAMAALTIEYPNGKKTRVDPNGSVFNAGTPFFGSIHDLKPASRQTFKEARVAVACDANDPNAGYDIHVSTTDGKSSVYRFDAAALKRIQNKEI